MNNLKQGIHEHTSGSIKRRFQGKGRVEARWSEEIHDEWIRNLAANNPELFQRTIAKNAKPDGTPAMMSGYEPISEISLPDADDRHVVAAGISAGASTIITLNTRDFPSGVLQKHGMTRQTPDHFLLNLYSQLPDVVVPLLQTPGAT